MTSALTSNDLMAAARFAILGMSENERTVFVSLVESGEAGFAALVAKAGFSRSINRSIEMANMALSDAKVMNGLAVLVGEAL